FPDPSPNQTAATPMPTLIASTSIPLWLPVPPASPPCANAAGAKSATPANALNNMLHFFLYCLLMNCRQEVVPGPRAAGLTLERPPAAVARGKSRLVVVGR